MDAGDVLAYAGEISGENADYKIQNQKNQTAPKEKKTNSTKKAKK